MPKLVQTTDDRQDEFELGALTTIGRGTHCTITLLDAFVSKEHCRVVRKPDGHFNLVDLGSSNGTLVSGRRVKEVQLKEGDVIGIGRIRLTFSEASAQHYSRQIKLGSALSSIQHGIDVDGAGFLPASQCQDDAALRRDYERLRVSFELSRAIGGVLDLEKLLSRILDEAFTILQADRGVILLLEQGK